MTSNADSRFSAAPTSAATSATSARRPRFAIFVATACGLGYLPKAPGTWGSLGGLLLALVPWWAFNAFSVAVNVTKHGDELAFLRMAPWHMDPFVFCQIVLTVLAAAIGVWSADRTADFWGVKDPQRVVIDEVSGQHLTLLLGCAVPLWWRLPKDAWTSFPFGFETVNSALNWKYLLLGFILFRVFDIWKPFPARQAESLAGGWGIMADDWMAGIYAGAGIWIARAAGL
jgi:phosphatidylglycerophosphatase A